MTVYEFLVPVVLFAAFYLVLRARVRKLDRGE